jgi:hypothetical protein
MIEPPTFVPTAAGVDALVARFQNASLTKDEWTHAAHLTVACWHLTRYNTLEALDLVRDGIQRLNAVLGIEQTRKGGYHETLTRFFVWAVAESLARAPERLAIEQLVSHVIAECGDRTLPFQYFSEELLFSWRARTGWVEPDLQPLPVRSSRNVGRRCTSKPSLPR